jgi:alcohol dehydrogenase class IV
VRELVAALRIPLLRTYGIRNADTPAIAAASAQASSTKANPIPLLPGELEAVLEQAL